MSLNYERLRSLPDAFRALTGLSLDQFDQLVADLEPQYAAMRAARLARADRQRAQGAGHPYKLTFQDRVLMAVFWLRHRVRPCWLTSIFGVTSVTTCRVRRALVPLLEGVLPAHTSSP